VKKNLNKAFNAAAKPRGYKRLRNVKIEKEWRGSCEFAEGATLYLIWSCVFDVVYFYYDSALVV
jgi:hypothetical protein